MRCVPPTKPAVRHFKGKLQYLNSGVTGHRDFKDIITWEPAEAGKASFGGLGWTHAYACDGCIVIIPSWFCLLWSFLSWGFPGCFWETHTGNKVLPLESQWSKLYLGTGWASKTVRTLIRSITGTGCTTLWQQTWAEPKVIRASIFLKGREGKGEKAKQYGREGKTPPTMIRLMHEKIGPPNP